MKEIDIISRLGKKTTDIKHFDKYLIATNIETIVEPFAGSFAVSKYYVKNIFGGSIHINDLDKTLIYIYKNYKEYIKLRNEIQNDLLDWIINKVCTKDQIIEIKKKKYNEILINEYIKNFIIRGIMHKSIISQKYSTIEQNILDTSTITNDDYRVIFDQYKNDENAFLFLDPPYIFSDNSSYTGMDNDDNTDMLYIIKIYMDTCKCKVMLIINDLKIIRYIYGDYVKGQNDKIYQLGKRKSRHLIITNYE